MKIIKRAIYPTFPLHLEGDEDYEEYDDDEEDQEEPTASDADFGVLGFCRKGKVYALIEKGKANPDYADSGDFVVDTNIPPLPSDLGWMLSSIKKATPVIYYNPANGVDSIKIYMFCTIKSMDMDRFDEAALKSKEFLKYYKVFSRKHEGRNLSTIELLYNGQTPVLSASGIAKVRRVAEIVTKGGKPTTKTMSFNAMREVISLPGEDAVAYAMELDDSDADDGPALVYSPPTGNDERWYAISVEAPDVD